jgi:hypothetical protein
VTESLQSLVRAGVTSDDEGVGLPGAKAEVTLVSVERQLARLESLLSEFKKVVQGAVIPAGMRGFAVELVTLAEELVVLAEEFVASDSAQAADISTEVSAQNLNIVFEGKSGLVLLSTTGMRG